MATAMGTGVVSEVSPCSSQTVTAGSNEKGDDKMTSETPKQVVIRLKRRIDDSPSKLLLVSYKRSKNESDSGTDQVPGTSKSKDPEASDGDGDNVKDQLCSRVLRLVGTVVESEVDPSFEKTVRNVLESSKSFLGQQGPKREYRQSVKAGAASRISTTSKVRQRFKRSLEDGRFKLVNSKRQLAEESEAIQLNGTTQTVKEVHEENKDLLNMLDLVPESELEPKKKRNPPKGFEPGNVTCNGVPMVKKTKPQETEDSQGEDYGYVYDLYVANDSGVSDDDLCYKSSQFVSVEEADEELDFGEYRENNAAEDEYRMEDDEDSNAEDNFRNDYPDSDEGDGGSDCENFYGTAGNSCYRYNGDGDHWDYALVNSLKLKDDTSSDDEDLMDGNERSYARYKRRVLSQFASEVIPTSSEEEDED